MAARILIAVWLVLVALMAPKLAHAQRIGETKAAGGGVEYTLLGSYSLSQLQRFITTDSAIFLQDGGSRFPSTYFPNRMRVIPRNDVALYRISYNTAIPEQEDQSTRSTGLIAIPVVRGAQRFPLISYQHGAVFDRNAVPSKVLQNPSIDETKLILAGFAAQGYVVIAADYVGLADSDAANTFFLKDTAARSTLDMYFASQQVLTALKRSSTRLFLHGWSQGGYNTLLLLKELERRGVKVNGASTAAAPTDLRGWIHRLIKSPAPSDASGLIAAVSNLIMAADSYTLPGLAEQAIKPDYLAWARQFYAFETDFMTFSQNVPRSFVEFLNADFVASAKLGESDFWRTLDANSNYRWSMSTPLRNYYGESDEVVPAAVAMLPARVASLYGTQTTAVSAGAMADHRGTFLFSVADAVAWHKQLPL